MTLKNRNDFLTGHVVSVLRSLPDDSVDCVVTSPPYYGLRVYVGAEADWGRWHGELGSEPTPELYLEDLLSVFDEVKRVLKRSGTLWVNISDTYDKKCLLLIPEDFAKEMKERSWILRNKICWYKKNPMPSSSKDRLTNTWEYLYFFVKNASKPIYVYNEKTGVMQDRKPKELVEGIDWEWREIAGKQKKVSVWHSVPYWFDLSAVRERLTTNEKRAERIVYDGKSELTSTFLPPNPSGKNPGDVIVVNTEPFPGSHFAVFPQKIPRFCIKAGCPKEVCPKCGKGRVRITKSDWRECRNGNWREAEAKGKELQRTDTHRQANIGGLLQIKRPSERQTLGWTSCDCGEGYVPGVVLDPFGGSGTVAAVAWEQGRDFTYIDIKQEYIDMAKKRLEDKMREIPRAGDELQAETLKQEVLKL